MVGDTIEIGSIFDVKPSIPVLRGPGGGLVVAPDEKTSLLGTQFDSKHCREQFVTPLFVSLSLGAILWPCELLSSMSLLLDLDTYVGIDALGVFPLFLKVSDIIAPQLIIIFRRLIRLGSFQECWRSAIM